MESSSYSNDLSNDTKTTDNPDDPSNDIKTTDNSSDLTNDTKTTDNSYDPSNDIKTTDKSYDLSNDTKTNDSFGKYPLTEAYGTSSIPQYSTLDSSGKLPAQQEYCQPGPQYGQPGPQYGQPMPQYGQPMPQYGQPGPQYGGGYTYNPAVGHIVGTDQVVITTQPIQAQMIDVKNAPPDLLVWSILSTFFCCFPIGIGAIVASVLSRSYLREGDIKRARWNSNCARILNLVAFIIGLTLYFIAVLLKYTVNQENIYSDS